MNDNGPGGVIWANGIHRVYVGGKPTRVFTPQYGVHNTYNTIKKQLKAGGIPLGIDHLPENVLAENPILAKTLREADIDPYNVGIIKDVEFDGTQIVISDAEITNKSVGELYAKGELPAYSIVGLPVSNPCGTDKADIVVDDFHQVKRVDFVPMGGCQACQTDIEAKSFLTAKLVSEEDMMVEENDKNKDLEEVNKTEKAVPVDEEVEEKEVEGEDLEEEEVEEVPAITLEGLAEKFDGLADSVKAISDAIKPVLSGEVEAKLPDEVKSKLDKIEEMELHAKKVEIEGKIDGYIRDGKVLPSQKEGLVEAGLANPSALDKILKASKTKVEFGQRSKSSEGDLLEASKSEENDLSALNDEDFEDVMGFKRGILKR